jgi:hypothetical protein
LYVPEFSYAWVFDHTSQLCSESILQSSTQTPPPDTMVQSSLSSVSSLFLGFTYFLSIQPCTVWFLVDELVRLWLDCQTLEYRRWGVGRDRGLCLINLHIWHRIMTQQTPAFFFFGKFSLYNQPGLKFPVQLRLTILPQPPECWDYRRVRTGLAINTC